MLDAVIAMSSDLDMHNVLDRIVVSSCELTGAQYGALGVIGTDGLLSDFIVHGIAPDQRAKIGELPRGRGILGLLIDKPEALRLTRLQDHPASFGFPANHPPMTSFLGVPVRIRGTVFGNLYLTEKAGGSAFTEQDEILVQALASAAGFVIENARAYALSERQRTWLEASSHLNSALQPPLALSEALQHVAVGAQKVSGARAVGVLRVDDSGIPKFLASVGRDREQLPALAEQHRKLIVEVEGGSEVGMLALPEGHTTMVLPMRGHLFGSTVLLVLLEAQQSLLRQPAKEHELIMSFAEQAALTLDRVQARADREELAIVSDRDRIARDLHDLVIQRLFATGLQLQGIRAQAVLPAVQKRLDRAVEDLDTTIRDIRSTIFELQHRDQTTLRAEVTPWSTSTSRCSDSRRRCAPAARWTRLSTIWSGLSSSPYCERRCPTWPGTPAPPGRVSSSRLSRPAYSCGSPTTVAGFPQTATRADCATYAGGRRSTTAPFASALPSPTAPFSNGRCPSARSRRDDRRRAGHKDDEVRYRLHLC